jgi:2-C-methyl-D-erythritol 4-phosphate cytidylyltransferase
MKYYAIIVAGGSGSRMNTEVPKQFLLLNGQPVLMHTISAFYFSELQPEIILVLNKSYQSYWKELLNEYRFSIPHKIVSGGTQRFDSVKNALDLIQEESIIAVHDAVRPIVSKDLIKRCYKEAEEKGNAIPVVSPKDSLRKKEGNQTIAINREDILIVQTPQVFQSEALKKAYSQAFVSEFTDDASVVERAGFKINVIEGEQKNLKITYEEDLEIASVYLEKIDK